MKCRIAIAGIGNVASALVQGVEDQKRNVREGKLAELYVNDIQFVLGFDVDTKKVGKDISEAIFSGPNNTRRIYNPPNIDAPVVRGPLKDGVAKECLKYIEINEIDDHVDVVGMLKEYQVDIICILVPTGALDASRYYAMAGLEAGCAVLNCTPNVIANDEGIVNESIRLGLPIIGDDIKAQIGATILHRSLLRLFKHRGVNILSTLQLDWGGDMDFANLVIGGRYDSGKRRSKTQSVEKYFDSSSNDTCRVSAVEYFPYLKNTKEALIKIDGSGFGAAPVNIELRLKVEDAYNAAGVIVDAVRVLAYEKKKSYGGVIEEASSYYCKLPPNDIDDDLAKDILVKKYNNL